MARAVSTPMPEAAPVTIARLPARPMPSITSAAVESKPNGVEMRSVKAGEVCRPLASVPMKVAAISGSLQERSSNSALIRAANQVAPEDIELVEFRSLGKVPHLNPELERDGSAALAPVEELRALLGAAEGLLIASPEYGHSMPGVLKNALDWLVASGELSGMPIALISASTTTTGGIRAQMALTQTLLAQAGNVAVTLTIPAVKGKLDGNGELAHPATRRRIRETLVALGEAIEERRAWPGSRG
jgi:chromate reductase